MAARVAQLGVQWRGVQGQRMLQGHAHAPAAVATSTSTPPATSTAGAAATSTAISTGTAAAAVPPALAPVTGARGGAGPPCCTEPSPDGDGRKPALCMRFAPTGGCDLTRNAHAMRNCPAACGACRVCEGHRMYAAYALGGELYLIRQKAAQRKQQREQSAGRGRDGA